jgi:RNA-splicing ligase RtcB
MRARQGDAAGRRANTPERCGQVAGETQITFEKLDDCRWMIPKTGRMRVPGIIYADEKMMTHIRTDKSPQQVANVAHLPGIVKYSLAMPDIHWGYGFPIGGVAATETESGVISPGGVGYARCGCRLMTTHSADERRRDKGLVSDCSGPSCQRGVEEQAQAVQSEERKMPRPAPGGRSRTVRERKTSRPRKAASCRERTLTS